MVKTEFLNSNFGEEKAMEMYSAMPHMVSQDIADALIYALSTPENVQVIAYWHQLTEKLQTFYFTLKLFYH